MDIGGPQYDVHSSDCSQFTGKRFFLFTISSARFLAYILAAVTSFEQS